MSIIKTSNLTFGYDSSNSIFENVSFVLDTDWKLGLIGRNGKGKTTLLNLFMNKYDYYGSITSSVQFDYYPFNINNKDNTSYEIAEQKDIYYEKWKFEKETSLLNISKDKLIRPFDTLSNGEQTKVMLAILFSKNNQFLLIDEPTNHLDIDARETVSKYLKSKKGFILVSHDRLLLNDCVDHILSINRTNIKIDQGNFSSWYENKVRQDDFEFKENEKLKKEIKKLEKSAKQTAEWSNKIESSKYRMDKDVLQDKGYIGHKSAKMMKRSLVAQNRKDKAIEEKSELLKNIETIERLKFISVDNRRGRLIDIHNMSIIYNNRSIFNNINLYAEKGDRLHIKGNNGSGKSSILKLILGQPISYEGELCISSDLKISYVPKNTSYLSGSLDTFIKEITL